MYYKFSKNILIKKLSIYLEQVSKCLVVCDFDQFWRSGAEHHTWVWVLGRLLFLAFNFVVVGHIVACALLFPCYIPGFVHPFRSCVTGSLGAYFHFDTGLNAAINTIHPWTHINILLTTWLSTDEKNSEKMLIPVSTTLISIWLVKSMQTFRYHQAHKNNFC